VGVVGAIAGQTSRKHVKQALLQNSDYVNATVVKGKNEY
jgi:hypothetical protein